MGQLATLYDQMAEKLTRYLGQSSSPKLAQSLAATHLMSVMPLAALISMDIVADSWQVEDLTNRLLATDLTESHLLSGALKTAANQLWPDLFKDTVKNKGVDAPQSVGELIAKIANELPQNLAAHQEEIGLLEVWPRQEFDLLADSFYAHSSLPREDIILELQKWNYQKKYDALSQTINSPKNELLSKARYRFDIVADRHSLINLIGQCRLDNIEIQSATPRYGYEVPSVFEEAGIDDLYMECFDQSLELFSSLQAAGQDSSSAYTTLFGHKVRAQFTISASQISKFKAATESTQNLRNSLIERISEFHPIISDLLMAQDVAKVEVIKAQPPKPQKSNPSPSRRHRTRGKRRKST
jgi:hypothetical protein